MMSEHGPANNYWLRRLRSGCALLMASLCVIVGLVGASVVGNRVNAALPRGFGLVGMLVTVSVVLAMLIVLISPRRLWQRTQGAVVSARTSLRDNERRT
jgi:hypothetical protein